MTAISVHCAPVTSHAATEPTPFRSRGGRRRHHQHAPCLVVGGVRHHHRARRGPATSRLARFTTGPKQSCRRTSTEPKATPTRTGGSSAHSRAAATSRTAGRDGVVDRRHGVEHAVADGLHDLGAVAEGAGAHVLERLHDQLEVREVDEAAEPREAADVGEADGGSVVSSSSWRRRRAGRSRGRYGSCTSISAHGVRHVVGGRVGRARRRCRRGPGAGSACRRVLRGCRCGTEHRRRGGGRLRHRCRRR